MIHELYFPRQLEEELQGVYFHDSDINMRQLALLWSESGQEDGFDGFEQERVDFRAERVTREARQVRQEGMPKLIGVGQGAEYRQFQSSVGGGSS